MIRENTLVQDRYFVKHLIGQGGMGSVYLAEDTRFNNRVVALKELASTNEPKLETAFSREANLLAQLQHPRLPKVSDYFNDNGRQYLVMEYVSGDDLFKLLQRTGKAFPVERVLKWADSLLDILGYLHSHNPPVIHRDIKPQNLKLNKEDLVILLDFGLAKDTLTHLSRLSSSKSLLGFTPDYAPLEQVRGDRTTEQSDIYSFSATFYQLMTNTPAVSSLTRVQAKVDEVSDPLIAPHILNPEVPIGISEILMQGLSLKQEGRPRSAVEMRRTFQQIITDQKNAQERKTEVIDSKNVVTDILPNNVETYLPQNTGGFVTGESTGRIKFQNPTPVFSPQPLIGTSPPPNDLNIHKKKEGNYSVALFGILAGVLVFGIAATFFIGKWISERLNPVAPAQQQQGQQQNQKTETSVSATENIKTEEPSKNTNNIPVFEKPAVKPVNTPAPVRQPKNDKKTVEPKPAPEIKKPVQAPTIFQ